MSNKQVDLLVYGGGVAGVEAACAAAAAGKRCLLVERRTYLGHEITATGRYWLAEAEGLPPVPDQLKLALEERLLAAGVELLYGLRPIRVDGAQIEFVGKGGRLTVTAREYLNLARQTAPAGRGERTLELTGVDLAHLAEASVPATVVPYCRIDPGPAVEHGHVLVTYGLEGDDLQVRLAAPAVVRWLKEKHPAFADARWTASAPDVVGAAPTSQPEELKVDVLVIGGGTS
ncbi:MAG: FAD-dependent oxidoreductase, partial [Mycobacterium leprae]